MAVLPANAKTIWDELLQAGATPVEAAGMMGNMLHETIDLSPELKATDTNGYTSYGLVMWNAAPGTDKAAQEGRLITGNVLADIRSQVNYLKATGGFAAAAGADPYNAGVSFAHDYEKCAQCGYEGNNQLAGRGASAVTVYQVAQSGAWGAGLPSYGQGLTPSTDPSAAQTPATTTGFSLNPLNDIEQIWGDIGGAVSGAEKFYQGMARFLAMLIAPSTWIRTGEVVLGTLMASAGLAMYAIVLAGEHPNAIADLAALIPGEGQVARIGIGALTSARSGSVTRTVAGGARAARATPSAGRAPKRAGAGGGYFAGAGPDTVRAGRQVAGTIRRASPSGGRSRAPTARTSSAPKRSRVFVVDRAGRAEENGDEAEYRRAREAGRRNRDFHRRTVGTPRRPSRDDPFERIKVDTSDLRRRTP